VRDHALQDVVGVALDDEALVGDDCRARDTEPDEEQVEDGLALDQDGPETHEESLSQFGVTLVERGAKRTSGLEGSSCSSTKPFWKEESADQRGAEIWCHPDLVTGVSLSSVVTGWDVQEELHDTAGDDSRKCSADEPAELVLAGEDDERSAENQNDWQGEQGDGEQDWVERQDTDEE